MSENFESTYESSLPTSWKDTVIFGGEGTDTISFNGAEDFVYAAQSVPFTYFGNSSPDTITFNLNMSETKNHLWKYNEDKILKDVEDYVTSTYHGHYCGDEQGYDDIQTIDLMAAKKLAAGFCQANILKYGSRYGDKDGRNKRDLLKVIHYAMLLLHFDGHYSRKDNGLSEFR
jgi:hypothetical protein